MDEEDDHHEVEVDEEVVVDEDDHHEVVADDDPVMEGLLHHQVVILMLLHELLLHDHHLRQVVLRHE